MRGIKKLIFTGLTIIFVFSCVELIGFAVLKLRDHDKGIDSSSIHRLSKYRLFELNPNYRGRKFQKGYKPHSSDGFRRNSSISVNKPKNVIRIFYMGGSQLYGAEAALESGYSLHRGLLNSEGIDKVSEDLLNEKLKNSKYPFKVEVINAGVINYHSFQHLFYIMEKIYRYSPDFIVHLDGANDFYNINPAYNHLLDYHGVFDAKLVDYLNERDFLFATYIMVRSLSPFSYFFSAMERFILKSLIYGWIETLFKTIDNDNMLWKPEKFKQQTSTIDNLKPHYTIYAHNTFIRAYRLIQKLGDHYGFKTLVFHQPQITFENTDNLGKEDIDIHEKTIKLYKSYKKVGADGVYNMEVRAAIREMLPSLFQQYGILFHDISEIASPNKIKTQLYVDYTHLTPEGAHRVGTKMAIQLFPHILFKLKNDDRNSGEDK